MSDLAKLREPFPASQVGKLPKGGTSLDFVGHGAVTERLLDVDPSWNWEPLSLTDEGLPRFEYDTKGNPVGLWIRLTVGGVTRLGYGSCAPGQFEAVKVLIGDALRNSAMRFGVALDLWVRGHAEDDEKVSSSAPKTRRQFGKPQAKQLLASLLGEEAKDAWSWGSADDLSDYSEAVVRDLAQRWNERPMEAS